MFNRNPNGSSLFGNLNTSTPTSTPGPTQQPGNNAMFGQKQTGGLFNNVNAANNVGTSTPSPSAGLFGNSNQNNPNQMANNTSSNLFGNKPTQPSTGLFGNSNTTSLGTNNTTSSGTTGGLFGNKTTTTNASTGGLFGNNSSALGTSNPSSSTAGGLFGNSQGTGINATKPGGLFGNNPSTTTTNSTLGGGLFGKSNTNTTANPSASSNVFGNSTGASLFGQNNNTTKPSMGGLFGNGQTQNSQQASNPYGLNVNNANVNMGNMPASITESLQNKAQHGSTNKATISPKPTSTASRNSSISFNSSIQSPLNVPHSNLFSKLSSRLSTVKKHNATKGIFSQPWSQQEYYKQNGLLLGKKKMSLRDINSISKRSNGVSELRKLKIDSNRSAAKKLKLLSGNPVTTKEEEENEVRENSNESVTPSSNQNSFKNNEATKLAMTENNAVQISSPNNKNNIEPTFLNIDPTYWCSPSIESLSKLPSSQLSSVPNFVIGRKGYGNISFNFNVDLTAFKSNLADELFGKVIIFHSSKTVEVYPDGVSKPPVGYGLNVPATITLENIYPINRKTKKPIKDASKTDEMQVLIKKLKSIRDMEFISYNPFGGIWTFKVNHFSIWGLVNEEDVEIDVDAIENNPNHGVIEQNMDISGEANQRNLAVMQQSEPELHNELDILSKPAFIEEKQYEPDVNEEDFDALQVEPTLHVSNDWIEQLNLAGSSEYSIFSKHFDSRSKHEQLTNLLEMFDNDVKLLKNIKNELKLTSNSNFATFVSNGDIIMEKNTTPVGAIIYHPSFEKIQNSILQMKFFEKQINHADITRRNSSYPLVNDFKLSFSDIYPELPKNDKSNNTWKLCSILFDTIELPYTVDDENVKAMLLKNSRYDKLCLWLIEEFKDDVMNRISETTSVLHKIFLYLMINDIVNATKLAIESQNKHLAVLLTYLGSNDPRVRELSSNQLKSWNSSGHIVNDDIIRIYELLSGKLFDSSRRMTELCQEYNLLTVFSLGIFYGNIDELELNDLVSKQLSAIPRSEDNLQFAIFEQFSEMKSIEKIFKSMTSSVSKSDLNIQFSWYLIEILKYSKLGEISSELNDKLTLQFIEELKLSNLPLQALFISLFLENDEVAKQQIDLIAYMAIPDLWNDPSNQDIIMNKLKLPRELVFRALALSEKYQGNHIKEVEYLLSANLYESAEEMIISEVGPSLVLSYNQNKDLSYLEQLQDYLNKIPNGSIKAYDEGLLIFDNFIRIIKDNKSDDQMIETLKSGLESFYENNKHKRIVPACCDVISKHIQYLNISQ